jgi:hypothetical protein
MRASGFGKEVACMIPVVAPLVEELALEAE